MAIKLNYTGAEALEIIQTYYPQDWSERIENSKNLLIRMAKNHDLTEKKVYEKFICPISGGDNLILFFAALADLLKEQSMSKGEHYAEIIALEKKRSSISAQIIALETNTIMNYEDQKILRGYYVQLQQATTRKIDELRDALPVVDSKLVIYCPRLFG